MHSKAVLNAASADIAYSAFTQADAALATIPTGQTLVNAGAPTTVSNQASLPNTAKSGITHNSSDVMVRAKLVSKNGEAVYARGDATGYWYVTNNTAGNTVLAYFTISGSVTTVFATVSGAAANDIITLLVQGDSIEVIRNNNIIAQVRSQLGAGAKEHGIRNALGAGTVLVDDLFIQPLA
jgi:hypothetical protein